jgi:hypothetical protein
VAGLTEDDEAKISEKAADTPAFSLAAIVTDTLRASKADANKVKEDDVKGPKEHEVQKSVTGVPWIDEMLVEEG